MRTDRNARRAPLRSLSDYARQKAVKLALDVYDLHHVLGDEFTAQDVQNRFQRTTRWVQRLAHRLRANGYGELESIPPYDSQAEPWRYRLPRGSWERANRILDTTTAPQTVGRREG